MPCALAKRCRVQEKARQGAQNLIILTLPGEALIDC
jgi:hypothetical protein